MHVYDPQHISITQRSVEVHHKRRQGCYLHKNTSVTHVKHQQCSTNIQHQHAARRPRHLHCCQEQQHMPQGTGCSNTTQHTSELRHIGRAGHALNGLPCGVVKVTSTVHHASGLKADILVSRSVNSLRAGDCTRPATRQAACTPAQTFAKHDHKALMAVQCRAGCTIEGLLQA